MKINYEITKSILETLPIGFYLKRDIPVYLSPDGNNSFYNPVEGKITLSYPLFSNLIKDKDIENDKLEDYIRNLLYHEISHVILTPNRMRVTDIINIFEDERIETILKKYYHRVDFKKFVKEVNKYKEGEEPKNPMQEFFRVVRFREGEKRFVDRVNQIIKDNLKLNASNEYYEANMYIWSINDLYNDIVNKWEEKKRKEEEKMKTEIEKGGPDISSSTKSKDLDDDKKEDKDKATGSTEDDTKTDEDKKELEPEKEIVIDEEEIEKELGEQLAKKAMDKIFSKYENKKLEQDFKQVLFKYSARKQNGAKAINGYNGRLTPRMTLRDDYKWFLHQNDAGCFNRFAKTRLNLFIDTSGSFCSSEEKINEIVKALINIEKSRDDFEVCIATMGDENKIVSKDDRTIHCGGGNYLTHEIYGIYDALQNKQKNNYNIVVFDGDAQSFDGWSLKKSRRVLAENNCAFGAFNHPNTTIISDYSNKNRILEQSPRSKNIFTEHYVAELQDNIIKMIGQLIR